MRSCPTAARSCCSRGFRMLKQQSGTMLVLSVSVALSLLCTTARADAYRKHHPTRFPRHWDNTEAVRAAASVVESVRGGAKAAPAAEEEDDDEAAELDAYIEQLLQEAGEEEQQSTSKATRRKGDKAKKTAIADVKTVKRKTKKSKVESVEANADSTENPKVKKSSKKTKQKKTVTKKVAKKKTILSSVSLADSSDAAGETDATVNPASQQQLDTNTTLPPNENVKQTSTETSIDEAEEHSTAVATSHDDSNLETRQQLQRPPPPPPNGLYRFLLRRAGGFGGRALVLMLVTASEFLHTYIPVAAAAGDWVWEKVFPPPKGGRRRGAPPPSSSVNAASVSHMVRTGVSRKKRRKFTKQADQQALRQLQQGTASEIRYAFCSRTFCQRHGLGKWAASSSAAVAEDGTSTAVISMEDNIVDQRSAGTPSVQEPTGGPKKTRKKKQDWVLAALTKEPPRHKTTPTLTLEAGSQGLTIGVELDWSGRKERVRAALTLPSKSKSTSSVTPSNTSPRKSDADAGVLGRLRTAAGSSALRSLSGAYPGDALTVNEAGNALGLADFASKYGYGDWSSEEDEEDLGSGGRRRRKRSRKRQTPKNSFGSDDDIEFSFSSGGSSSSTRKTRRAPRSLSPEIALSSSSTLSRRKGTISNRKRIQPETGVSSNQSSDSTAKTVASRRVELAKPALTRTQELLKKKKSAQSADDE